MEALKQQFEEHKAEQDKKHEETQVMLRTIMAKLDKIPEVEQVQRGPDVTQISSSVHDRSTYELGTNSNPRPLKFNVKLECPKFDGSSPRNWINMCERYFELCKIPVNQRVDIASFHMIGKAEEWICSYMCVDRVIRWNEFVEAVINRFRDEVVIESEVKDKIGEKNDKSVYEVVGEVHDTVETKVSTSIAPEMFDESPKMNSDILLEVKKFDLSHEGEEDCPVDDGVHDVYKDLEGKEFSDKGEGDLEGKVIWKVITISVAKAVVGEVYEVKGTVETKVFVGWKVKARSTIRIDRKLICELDIGIKVALDGRVNIAITKFDSSHDWGGVVPNSSHEWQLINKQKPIWLRKPAEITKDEVLTWKNVYCDNNEQPDTLHIIASYSYDGQYSCVSLGLAVARMSLHIHSLGKGIVGKVAIIGKHMWIPTCEYVLDSCSLLEYSDWLLPHFHGDSPLMTAVPPWITQGPSTVHVTPTCILDHRVIHLHNSDKVQYLVKWNRANDLDKSWVDVENFVVAFLALVAFHIVCTKDEIYQIALTLAVLISKIARIDYHREWPELFSTLSQQLQSADVITSHRIFMILFRALKELSTKRLAAGQRNFVQISSQFFDYSWQLWQRDIQSILHGFSRVAQSVSANDSEAHEDLYLTCQRWFLCSKIIRQLVIDGVQGDAKSIQKVRPVKEISPLFLTAIESVLPHYSSFRKKYPKFWDFLKKSCTKSMKILIAIQKCHPYSFGDKCVLQPVIHVGLNTIADPGQGLISFEQILIQCMSVLQTILECKEYKQNLEQLNNENKVPNTLTGGGRVVPSEKIVELRDKLMKLVERIMSAPKARTVLVNGVVCKGERLVPPSALELMLRVIFPTSSARVKATERFETTYPILAGVPGSKGMQHVSQQILTIWTMQDGILFDNILITSDDNVVVPYRKTVEAKNSLDNYACNMKLEATKISEKNVFVFDPGGECSTWSNGMVPLLQTSLGKMLKSLQRNSQFLVDQYFQT